jgi:Flp pilus assembly pilin Flp
MRTLIIRLMCEDCGQDVIEYALLAAFIGIIGIVSWQNIGVGIGAKYVGWDTGVQALSSPPDPVGGS